MNSIYITLVSMVLKCDSKEQKNIEPLISLVLISRILESVKKIIKTLTSDRNLRNSQI